MLENSQKITLLFYLWKQLLKFNFPRYLSENSKEKLQVELFFLRLNGHCRVRRKLPKYFHSIFLSKFLQLQDWKHFFAIARSTAASQASSDITKFSKQKYNYWSKKKTSSKDVFLPQTIPKHIVKVTFFLA